MSRFAKGDRVRFRKGVFLHKGIFVTGEIRVDAVHADDVATAYDVRFVDRECQEHVIPRVVEAELLPADG